MNKDIQTSRTGGEGDGGRRREKERERARRQRITWQYSRKCYAMLDVECKKEKNNFSYLFVSTFLFIMLYTLSFQKYFTIFLFSFANYIKLSNYYIKLSEIIDWSKKCLMEK